MADSTNDDHLQARLEALFHEELQDNLAILAGGLAELGRDPSSADGALVRRLFRAAHSLKGAAHSAGTQAALDPCHRLEELLSSLRTGDRSVDATLLEEYAAQVALLTTLEAQISAARRGGPVSEATDTVAAPTDEVGEGRGAQRGSARARIAADDLEELIHRAGDLVASTHRLHDLTASLIELRDGDGQLGGVAPFTGDPGNATVERGRLERLADEAGAIERRVLTAARQVADTATHLRLQPLSELVDGLGGAVAELCRSTGKLARVLVTGSEVGLDRDVGDALREPLLHIVRNAIDHGIESPDERIRRGKPREGLIEFRAETVAGRVRLVISDDGSGVDAAVLRRIAAERGLIGDQADTTENEVLQLAFLPGLSTASVTTAVSGRGVGLDAARARVESLGGTVDLVGAGHDLHPTPTGTSVIIHVPVSLTVVRVLLVEAGGELLGVPISTVARCRRLDPLELRLVGGRYIDVSGDRSRRAVPLAAVLGFRETVDPDRVVAVELIDGGELLVDRLVGEHEGLLQRLPERAAAGALVMGAVTIPPEQPVLVLNPQACLRLRHSVQAASSEAERVGPVRLLLVEDALTTRALLHSILVDAGFEVTDAPDGLAAWEMLQEQAFDVIVSDIDMPRMDGVALCRMVRGSNQHREVPVVLVTSMASDDDRRRGLEAGANAYLVKSAFDEHTLLEAIRRLV